MPAESDMGLGEGVTSIVPVKDEINSILTKLYAGNPVPLTATSDPGGPLPGCTPMAGSGAGVGAGVGGVSTKKFLSALTPPAVTTTEAVSAWPAGTTKAVATLPSGPTMGGGEGVTSTVPILDAENSILTKLYAGNPVPVTSTTDPGCPRSGDTFMAATCADAALAVNVMHKTASVTNSQTILRCLFIAPTRLRFAVSADWQPALAKQAMAKPASCRGRGE